MYAEVGAIAHATAPGFSRVCLAADPYSLVPAPDHHRAAGAGAAAAAAGSILSTAPASSDVNT